MRRAGTAITNRRWATGRLSGISLGCDGASVVAGLLPVIATGLFGVVGWIGPASMLSGLGAIAFPCASSMRETAPAVTGKRAARVKAHDATTTG